MNFDLIKEVLLVSIAASIISTSLIQRIKESIMTTHNLPIISLIVSMLLGLAFTLTFTNLTYLYGLWVGLLSFIGADLLYKTFEDKIFSSLSSLVIDIERDVICS